MFYLIISNTLNTSQRETWAGALVIKQHTEVNQGNGIGKFGVAFDIVEVHSLDFLPCDIKGNTEQASNGNSEKFQFVLCKDMLRVKRIIVVWRSVTVINIYWTIIIVYAEECDRRITIKEKFLLFQSNR